MIAVTDIEDGYLPVAEVIAASLCWLARWNEGEGVRAAVGRSTADQVGFWHRLECRFCGVKDLNELLALGDLSRCRPDELRWWNTQDRRTRAAKVYEAQEAPWWEQMQ